MSNNMDIGKEPDLELLGYPVDEPSDEQDFPDEGDEMPEGAEQAPAEDDDPAPQAKRDPVIPRARFDEVNAKLHAEREERARLEAEIAALRAPKDAPEQSAVDLKALKRQVFELRLTPDGEDEADLIEEQIEAERDRRAEARATAALEQREAAKMARQEEDRAQAEAAELSDIAGILVAQYPWLDSVSGEGDPKAIREVIALRSAYHETGLTLADALVEAASTIAKARGAAVSVIPTATDKRKQAAAAAAARVSLAQPPRADAGIGNRATPRATASALNNVDEWLKRPENDSELQRLLA